MKRLALLMLCLMAVAAHGQGLNVAWSRFNAVRGLGFCENPYSIPTNIPVWHVEGGINVSNTLGAAPSNGQSITNWSDPVSGQKFTQFSSATINPKYDSTGTNSHPALIFDTDNTTASDYMTNLNGVTYNQPSTAIFVVNLDIPASSSFGQELLDSGSSGRAILQANNSNNHLGIYAGTLIEGAAIRSGSGHVDWFVFTGQFNGASSLIRTNGVSYVTGNAGTNPFIGFSLGGFLGKGWGGAIAEGYFFNALLTTTEMRNWENYLMGKYCIVVPP